MFIYSSRAIQDVYSMDKLLGESPFASIYRGKHRSTGDVRAIKRISKSGRHDSVRKVHQQIAMMLMMDHPNIVSLVDTYEDEQHVYLVMELCAGGQLIDRIIDAGRFSEREAATVMQQLFRAISYMCQLRPRAVCHRDVKPENLLLATKEPIGKNLLKLIDFGLATFTEPGYLMRTRCDTPERCDVWSAGVIMYTLLCGHPPIQGQTNHDVFTTPWQSSFNFSEVDQGHISCDARDLISDVMKAIPQERCSAQQALSHRWIRHKAMGNDAQPTDFFTKLSRFQAQRKAKKAMRQAIAGYLNDSEAAQLEDTLALIGDSCDGSLTLQDLKTHLSPPDVRRNLQLVMDSVGNCEELAFDYTELLATALDSRRAKPCLDEHARWRASRVFDHGSFKNSSQCDLQDAL